MSKNVDVEAALRASLAERAEHAPPGGFLAERIIAQTEQDAANRPRRARQWRTWTLPLITAGSVAAVVAAAVGISHIRPSADHQGPAAPITSVTSPVHTPTPPVTPTTHPTTPLTTNPGLGAGGTNAVGLTNVHVLDLTFTGTQDGWGLATADCTTGTSGTCTAVVRTTDGGQSWHSLKGPGANIPGVKGCAAPCVDHLRFATSKIGYAYGPSALFMTTDGSQHWTQIAGLGADALETLNNNVILVRGQNVACPDNCPLFETARVGSSTWTPVSVPGWPGGLATVSLTRTKDISVLGYLPYNPAKGAGGGQGGLIYTSTDNGATWTKHSDPCPSAAAGARTETSAVTASENGSVVADCATTPLSLSQGTGRIYVSQDGGQHYTASGDGSLGPSTAIAAPSRSDLFEAIDNGLYRSTNGGNSWTPLTQITIGTDGVQFLGFESATLGRVVTNSGTTIWTTHDAGQTWSRFTFG